MLERTLSTRINERGKKCKHDPEQYRLLFAPDDFKWSGENAHGLPIICESDGTICEPLLRFFGWSHRFKRVTISSMRDEAHVLREWKAYLDRRGLRWDRVNDQVLIDWREELKRERKALLDKWEKAPDENKKPMGEDRINRRLAVVFLFYDKAKASNLLKTDLVSTTGPLTCRAERAAPPPRRFSMAPERRVKMDYREWACAESSGRDMTKRPIPDDSAVSNVLTYLRNSAENEVLGNRDWLIGRVEAEAGLRADEVAKLTPRALEVALATERIRIPTPEAIDEARKAGWNPSYKGLDAIAEWEPGRRAVLGGLDRLQRAGRLHIYVSVTGKGNVTRSAPFPIDLVRDLITIGIWDVRLGQLRRWRNTVSPPGPPQMFLSEKTKKGLEARAIGNLVKSAFSAPEVKVEGSGHRLRAYFATRLAQRLWAKYFADNMFRWDQTVENTVLVELAQALGHNSPNTACRYYLDLGRAAYFKLGDKSQLKAMRKAVNAMAEHHRRITPDFFEMVGRLIEIRGAAGLDGAALDEVIADILEIHAASVSPRDTTHGGVEVSPNPARRGRPSLRVVPKNPDV